MTTALGLLWERRAYLGIEHSDPVPEPVARTELAAARFGDAHGLDDGRRLGMILLRAVDSLVGETISRRGHWERIGGLADRVSSTALTLGLQVRPTGGAGRRLAAYQRSWSVAHVTWRDLDEGLAVEPGRGCCTTATSTGRACRSQTRWWTDAA